MFQALLLGAVALALTGGQTPAMAEDAERAPECVYADYWLYSNRFRDYVTVSKTLPYRYTLQELRNQSGFVEAFNAWKVMKVVFDPGEAGGNLINEGDLLGEQGFFETMLIDIMYAGQDRADSFSGIYKYEGIAHGAASDAKTIAKIIDPDISDELLSTSDFAPDTVLLSSLTEELSDDQKNMMADVVDSDSVIASWSLGLSVGHAMFQGTKTVADYLEHYEQMRALCTYSQDMTDTLRAIASCCSDSGYENDLRDAALELARRIDADFNPMEVITRDGFKWEANRIGAYFAEWARDEVFEHLGVPWGTMQTTYKLGSSISNAWVSTDKVYEAYMKMECLEALENATRLASSQIWQRYDRTRSVADAMTLNSMTDFVFGMYDLGYDYAKDYLNIIDDSTLSLVLNHYGKPHAEAVSQLSNEQSHTNDARDMAQLMLGEVASRSSVLHKPSTRTVLPITISSSFANESGEERFHRACDISNDIEVTLGTLPEVLIRTNLDTLHVQGDQRIYALDAHRYDWATGSSLAMSAGASLEVVGDLTFYGLSMYEDSLLTVHGDMHIQGYDVPIHVEQSMSEGTIRLYGNMYFYGHRGYIGSDRGFYATQNCHIEFVGTGIQRVSRPDTNAHALIYVDEDWPNFNLGNVALQNPQVLIEDGFIVTLVSDAVLTLQQDLYCPRLNLNGHRLSVRGEVRTNLLIVNGHASIEAEQLKVGTNSDSGFRYHEHAIKHDDMLYVNGNLEYGPYDSMELRGGTVEITGNAILHGLQMSDASSKLKVLGNMHVYPDDGYSSLSMTDGKISLYGDLLFYGSSGYISSSEGFMPTENCFIEMVGAAPQTIECPNENRRYRGRRFDLGNVAIDNSQVTIDSGFSVTLMSDATITTPQDLSFFSLDLNGHSLSVPQQLTVGSLTVGSTATINASEVNITDSLMLDAQPSHLVVNSDLSTKTISTKGTDDLLEVFGSLTLLEKSQLDRGEVRVTGDILGGSSNLLTRTYGTALVVACGDGAQSFSNVIQYNNNLVNAHEDEASLSHCVTTSGNYFHDTTNAPGIRYTKLAHISQTDDGIGLTYDGIPMSEGVDYILGTITRDEDGRISCEATGLGRYHGTATLSTKPIGSASIRLFSTTYTGEAQTPPRFISYGGISLVEGTDYSLSWANNIEAGYGTMTVTGLNDFHGSISKSFTIERRSLNEYATSISVLETCTYDGTEKTPFVEVSRGNKMLVQGTDYTLSYSNNRNAGTASITVQGIGNYTSSKQSSFPIKKASATLSVSPATKEFGLEDPEYDFVVEGLIGDDTIDCEISRNQEEDGSEDLGEHELTVTLGDNPNYDVNMVDAGHLTIVPRRVSISVDTTDQRYSGSEIHPEVTVVPPEATYDASYENNVGVGTATVSISATGNYVGNLTKSFEILPLSTRLLISDATKFAGETDPQFEASFEDDLTIAIGEEGNIEYRLVRQDGESAGRYEITAELANPSPNIVVDIEPGTLTIKPFVDVNDETDHLKDILWIAESGISAGFENENGTKSFRPYQEVARCDMAAFLFRLARNWGVVDDSWQPSEAQKTVFRDVSPNTSHCREIWWLAGTGISGGWDVGGGKKEFRPLLTVKRQDMAAFLFRLAKLANRGGASDSWIATAESRTKFRDVSATAPDNHHDEVWWLAETGISQGWDAGGGKYEFRGLQDVARCDMAAFLHRLDLL